MARFGHNVRRMNCLVAIVNYRTPELVVDCLASLAAEVPDVRDVSVTVVDSASGDESLAVIAAALEANGWSSWVTLLPSPRNGGFAYGNNLAIRPALLSSDPPDFIWLLNPDTVVKPGALRALLQRMRDQPDAGIVGSRLEGPDGRTQTAAFRFFSILSELEIGLQLGVATRLLDRWVVRQADAEHARRTDWVSGASMLIRRQVIEEIGLMDEDYFLFFEEVDLCRRAHRAGWSVWHEPASCVVHLEGQSTGLGDTPRQKPSYWFESRRRYFVKHHGWWYALAADLGFAGGYSLWRLRMAMERKPHATRAGMLGALIRRSLSDGRRDGRTPTAP